GATEHDAPLDRAQDVDHQLARVERQRDRVADNAPRRAPPDDRKAQGPARKCRHPDRLAALGIAPHDQLALAVIATDAQGVAQIELAPAAGRSPQHAAWASAD